MRMPAIFVGHGSPMNAIENNKFTDEWEKIGKMYKPKGIVMISAHWYTDGVLTQDEYEPDKINDMYGFPEELYVMDYPVHGMKEITDEITTTFGDSVKVDNSWGIDHGAWSVLVHMYPDANIPVVQISVDRTKTPQEQFEIGQKIAYLRDKDYMIIASGNIVHNLRMLNPNLENGYKWAIEFDDYIEKSIISKNFQNCIDFNKLGDSAKLSVPTPDHYFPLLNLLGAVNKSEEVSMFNKDYLMGSVSMTGYIFK